MKRFFGILFLTLITLQIHVQGQNNRQQLRKLQMAEYAISSLYVDEVDENKLVEAAINKMLAQLDPHSTYSNPEEVKKFNEPLKGNFEGIGVQFQMMEDTLLVIQPVVNGPSEKVGILAGDRIVAVNDTVIAGVKKKTEDIMRILRGPKGSKVNLTIIRREVSEPLIFTVKRDKIPIHSMDAAYMIQKHVGYIRINRFGANTDEEFSEALAALKKKGMKDLILDLQGNGGGYLNTAINIANDFLGQKELIVYTQGRVSGRSDYYAKGNGKFQKGRLVVLIDEYSASASEIVTGAIQDWDRGFVVGRRSFGKGLVQRPIELPDGSMIRLTISRYYTPAGRCIQKPYNQPTDSTQNGDVKESTPEDNLKRYQNDLLNRYNKGELTNADSIHFPDSLKCYTHKLKRAVYGGGGIMPDYFVPIDTTRFTTYHRNLAAKGVIIKCVTKYIEKHRSELQKEYKNFAQFNKNFEITEDIISRLNELADESKIEFNQEQFDKSLPIIKTQLKGLIARDLWDMNEYFQIINENDDAVQTALRILNDGTYESKLRPHLDEKK